MAPGFPGGEEGGSTGEGQEEATAEVRSRWWCCWGLGYRELCHQA